MNSQEVREKFLKFFEKRGHKILPSASLVPENDPSALFITAGVQPLVPYILQSKHPSGNRLVSVQKCVRTTDIEDIGDNTHLTFFEMLGNWSLGDYFKEDAIKMSFDLLTDKDEGFGLDVNRLYVTVFEGDKNAPRDLESLEIWKKAGIPEERIYFRGRDNWWSPGDNGPCGPSTEMFYDLTEEGLGDLTPEQFEKADSEQKVVEVWNDVFMEYQKKDGKVIGKLPQKNVDTGAGFERLLAVLQKKKSVYETDLFEPIISKVREISDKENEKAERIVSDHIRASVFIVSDGVTPSNTDRGYILRRLIRRAVRYADVLGIQEGKLAEIINVITEQYKDVYSGVLQNSRIVKEIINEEEQKFRKTLERALKEFNWQIRTIEGGRATERELPPSIVFDLVTTYGFPYELVEEEARAKGLNIDRTQFENRMKYHQIKSRTAAMGKFKGGLADTSEETIKLHTAHHLLLAALQKVLSREVKQRGSNITTERLRIDFSFYRKLTDEEKKEVEDLVNEWISSGLDVVRKEMEREEAEKIGAEMEFGAKYPDIVSVYLIEDGEGNIISKEFCGGPHVENTSELGRFKDPSTSLRAKFKILKEEAVAAGGRRIKAILSSD